MDLKITTATGVLSGVVKAPSSKSYTIRALLSSLLAGGSCTVLEPLVSRDTRACMNVCEALGGMLKLNDNHVEVAGVGGKPSPKRPLVDCMNSGTTMRLAAAIASVSDTPVSFTGDDSLRSRPIQPLVDALIQAGVRAEAVRGKPPVKVAGPLIGGEISMPGDISSQYVSGLLMACPLAEKDSLISLTSPLKSRPYVDLTLKILEHYGIDAFNDGYRSFSIPAGQSYEAVDYTVEGDYSSAAFVLAAGAINPGEIAVENLDPGSLQADKKILEILKQMGAKVKVRGRRVEVEGGRPLEGCVVDLSDSPDLLPIVSVLGCYANGETEIVNTEHARIKECDRISAMATELKKMGADIEERIDGMKINNTCLKGAAVDGWRDHRIIMSLAVAGLGARGETAISGGEHIDVTYPGFPDHMKSLGARICFQD